MKLMKSVDFHGKVTIFKRVPEVPVEAREIQTAQQNKTNDLSR